MINIEVAYIKMVRGKEGIAKKDFLILFGTLILIGFILFVWAAWEPSLVSPVASGNYSASLKFICNTSIENPVNASLVYNASGGSTTLILATVYNTSANQSGFQNDSVNLLGLVDGTNYNFTCLISNQTGTDAYSTLTNVSMVTIDNTGPAVTFYGISGGDYINGSFVMSTLVVDAIRDVTKGGDVYVNVTTNNVTASQVNFLNIGNLTDGSGYYNLTIANSSWGDGNYNITIYANDSNSSWSLTDATGAVVANLNNSETLSLTIDTVSPTATYECTPSSVTLGQLATCVCKGSDATAGINYTSDGDTTTSTATAITYITTRSAGTFSRTCTVRDRAGNTIATAASASYTVTNPVSSGGTTTSGTTPSSTTTSTVATITPTSPATISNFASSSGVKEVKVEVTETATNVQVNIENYATTTPSAVSSSVGGAYKYMNINTQNLANKLSKATLKIQVMKSWVDNQEIAKEDISLFKYDETNDEWNELDTMYDSEDSNYYYYTVELTSFSYFAIAPKGASIIPKEEGEVPSTTGEEESAGFLGLPYWAWIVIILVIAIVIGGGAALRKKNQ